MSEERDLEGLSAPVTGATSGIGRAAAEELGRRGAEVVVHGRNRPQLGGGRHDHRGRRRRYGATKATLASMTRSWAAEFSPAGVRVNAIAAGPVLTAGAAPDRIEALGATTLLSRAARPAEIAEVIAFLASRRPATSPARSSPPTAAAPPSDPRRPDGNAATWSAPHPAVRSHSRRLAKGSANP